MAELARRLLSRLGTTSSNRHRNHLETTMSKLTISNLEEGRELDQNACVEVEGGFALPDMTRIPLLGYGNVLASYNSATIAQNPVNIIASGAGGSGDTVNYLGNVNVTPVNVSSAATVVQGGGLPV